MWFGSKKKCTEKLLTSVGKLEYEFSVYSFVIISAHPMLKKTGVNVLQISKG